LQDSVLLREGYPDHPLWRFVAFDAHEYKAFAGRLRETMASEEDPEDRMLKQAVPALTNRLDALADIVRAECRQAMVQSAEVSRSSLNILEDLAAGRLSFTLQRMSDVRPSSAAVAHVDGPPVNPPHSTPIQNLFDTEQQRWHNFKMDRTINTISDLYRPRHSLSSLCASHLKFNSDANRRVCSCGGN